MFLNISSDNIQISDGKNDIFLAREGIEDTLGPTLVELHKKDTFNNVFVLNGPGGFTNLRVGTLCVNLLNSVTGNKVEIFEISKVDLYQYFFDQGFFDYKEVLMYIGQRKNIRVYNFEKKNYEMKTLQEIANLKKNNYIFDNVSPNYRGQYFSNFEDKIITFRQKDELIVSYNNKTFSVNAGKLGLKPSFTIAPNYFIEPTIN